MPKRENAPIGAPVWIDLFTSDPEKSRAFYSQLMGWSATEPNPDFGGYFNFSKDDSLVAGGMKNDGSAGVPDTWNVYLAVEDAEATVAKATANGGGVIVPSMAIADMGSMAVITDAGGAAIGMWQPGTHKGMGVLAEPGAPAWFELHTRDYDASVQFYKDVFGWDAKTMSDTPEFRYTTLGEGEAALAGIMDSTNFLPEGVPAHWAVYLAVEDTDAAVKTTTELGGSLIEAPHDTPYGRIAIVADPTGAHVRLVAN
ncbi:MAG TPA: VOC family protein [Acidimicrobiia bacterium]|nr:VOC family protein [Acidimicrobiia bacterium]